MDGLAPDEGWPDELAVPDLAHAVERQVHEVRQRVNEMDRALAGLQVQCKLLEQQSQRGDSRFNEVMQGTLAAIREVEGRIRPELEALKERLKDNETRLAKAEAIEHDRAVGHKYIKWLWFSAVGFCTAFTALYVGWQNILAFLRSVLLGSR